MSEQIASELHKYNFSSLKSKYTPKEKCDSFRMENEIKNFNNNFERSLDHDLNNDQYFLEKNIGECGKTFCFYYYRLRYYSDRKIWDPCIKIYYDDYCDDILENLKESVIKIGIGGELFATVPFFINLFFASLLDKEIVEEEDGIIIPIVIFNLFNKKKFPLLYLNYNHVKFEIWPNSMNKKILKTELQYKYKKIYSKKNKMPFLSWRSIMSSIEELDSIITGRSISIRPRLVTKIIFIEFFSENELIEIPHLFEVRLYINKKSPITFKSDLDEIIRFDVDGKTFYGISLCYEYKTFEDLKYILNKKNPKNKEEYYEDSGINFSNIETDICFDLDKNYDNLNARLTYLHTNYIRMCSGMAGLGYA